MKLIQQLHDDATFRVVRNAKLAEAFEVKTRVIHGCLLSTTYDLPDCGGLNHGAGSDD